MTASRAEHRRPLVISARAVLVSLALLVPVAAWAQDAAPRRGPVQLAPPKALDEPTKAPAEEAPSSDAPQTARPLLPPAGTAIQVDSLSEIDPDSAGTLTAEDGGFGIDMWAGTDRGVVDALLPRLPVKAASTTMRGLMRRLLLSAAAVPDGPSSRGGLVALRARLLAEMGDLAGVAALLDATPGRAANPALAEIEADARFLANDNARACALASNEIREHDSAYWQKAFIFCQALAGQHSRASLGVELLRELGEGDNAFFSLVDGLAVGGSMDLERMPDPTPLHLAMARAAKVRLPPDVISSNRPGVLRAIAISPNAPVELRLEAAERAEAACALSIDTLRQLYTSVSFSEDALANPLSKAEAESGPFSRALLYRTALVQTVPTAQAEAVARAFELAREGGRYVATVRGFLPVLRRLSASGELVWFAPEAVRALLVAGQHDDAAAWLALLREASIANDQAAQALTTLMPIARLAGAPDADEWDVAGLAEWWEGMKDEDGARGRATLLYGLLDAVGDEVPDRLWHVLLDGPERSAAAVPHPALWRQLADASSEGRIGETVMLALLALGDGGPAAVEPLTLGHAIRSLHAVGLTAEARAIAVEAAAAAGL